MYVNKKIIINIYTDLLYSYCFFKFDIKIQFMGKLSYLIFRHPMHFEKLASIQYTYQNISHRFSNIFHFWGVCESTYQSVARTFNIHQPMSDAERKRKRTLPDRLFSKKKKMRLLFFYRGRCLGCRQRRIKIFTPKYIKIRSDKILPEYKTKTANYCSKHGGCR